MDYKELKKHIGHEIVCKHYEKVPFRYLDEVRIECKTCNEMLYYEIKRRNSD
jgi:hypothetical protein